MAKQIRPTQSPQADSPSPPMAINSPENQTIGLGSNVSSNISSLSNGQRSISESGSSASASNRRYTVASHSVRITKHGYAIDPVELRYPEIINQQSVELRRDSEAALDSAQIGHQMLKLIRGFWSQPAFPRGQPIKSESSKTIESILASFSHLPAYPHRATLGSMAMERLVANGSKSKMKNKDRYHSSSPSAANSESKRNGNGAGRSASGKKSAAEQNSNSPSPAGSPDESNLMKRSKDKLSSPPASNSSSPGSSGSSYVSATESPSIKTSRRRVRSTDSGLLSLFAPSIRHHQRASGSSHRHAAAAAATVATPPPTNLAPSNTYHSWIPKDKEQLVDFASQLLQKMEKIFSGEQRILNISSPCIVLGDIHGNLGDLRTYERSLWPKAPACLTSNYLFLGDYVDRGDYSVECVLYLFAMKLIAPNRFYLLRGNHEVAAIQKQYTFARECETKFGQQGRQVWANFNRVFDLMPVAAIIDSQIFCAHGGIPRTISDLRTLAKEIPSPLDNPEFQCPSAWEILWNDPITDSELIGMIEMDSAMVGQTGGQSQSAALAANSANSLGSSEQGANEPAAPGAGNGRERAPGSPMSEADAVLSSGPSVDLYYIRRDEQEPQVADIGGSALRTVPSDTSSVASTSPQQIMNDGFVANIKRGTAYLFSDQAINHFLATNKLSHVIRAHEVIPTGFAFHGDGRVITIFSSSKYCGLNNQAACALVAQDRIRILRLDTGDAGE